MGLALAAKAQSAHTRGSLQHSGALGFIEEEDGVDASMGDAFMGEGSRELGERVFVILAVLECCTGGCVHMRHMCCMSHFRGKLHRGQPTG